MNERNCDRRMEFSFKKLFKKMIDKDISKKELADAAGISYSSLSKLANNKSIKLESLMSICKVLDCSLDKIMECKDVPLNKEIEGNDL